MTDTQTNPREIPWVKTHVVDGRTVLVFLEPDGDDNILHIVTCNDGIFIDLKVTFGNDESDKAQKYFDEYDAEHAGRALAQRDKLLADAEAAADDEQPEEE
jgi:hypothetical protein